MPRLALSGTGRHCRHAKITFAHITLLFRGRPKQKYILRRARVAQKTSARRHSQILKWFLFISFFNFMIRRRDALPQSASTSESGHRHLHCNTATRGSHIASRLLLRKPNDYVRYVSHTHTHTYGQSQFLRSGTYFRVAFCKKMKNTLEIQGDFSKLTLEHVEFSHWNISRFFCNMRICCFEANDFRRVGGRVDGVIFQLISNCNTPEREKCWSGRVRMWGKSPRTRG